MTTDGSHQYLRNLIVPRLILNRFERLLYVALALEKPVLGSCYHGSNPLGLASPAEVSSIKANISPSYWKWV